MKVAAYAAGVGLLTGFFGVGGGFVVVPVLVLVFGYDTATAIGTSLLVIAINSAAALAARLGGHTTALDGPLLGLFAAAAILGAIAGRRWTADADPRRLGASFALVLIALAVYVGARSVTALA